MKIIHLFSLLLWSLSTLANTLPVGSGQTYMTFAQAAAVAQPGDTILFHDGFHFGGQFAANLQGTPDDWIYILSAPGATPIIQGGTNAIQLSEPAYLFIRGLTFQGQTGNGVNIDDGGTFDTPAHHIVIEDCVFRDMAASGNNDLLKLSGLDYFEVRNCQFLNGANGGSGIDMVGCHYGLIQGNSFENMGSNSIQAKGGTQYLRIEQNFFRNGGQRTLNLGGSTSLAFFRPQDAPFEAADILVYSNILVGSWAPLAFVGSVRVSVVNNTIYLPQNWVLRILQETVDPDRFIECGDNELRNNIFVVNNSLSTAVNTGPNTRPETFLYSNNVWFHVSNPDWIPNLLTPEIDGLFGQNPLLADPDSDDFSIPSDSPAAGLGDASTEPERDFLGALFASPRSSGAIEANPLSFLSPAVMSLNKIRVFPNPGSELHVQLELPFSGTVQMFLVSAAGQTWPLLPEAFYPAGKHAFAFAPEVPPGQYYLRWQYNKRPEPSVSWVKH